MDASDRARGSLAAGRGPLVDEGLASRMVFALESMDENPREKYMFATKQPQRLLSCLKLDDLMSAHFYAVGFEPGFPLLSSSDRQRCIK
jgi:hypothetical protein